MGATVNIEYADWFELRQQVGSYRSLHARAKKREECLKEKLQDLQEISEERERHLQQQLDKLTAENEDQRKDHRQQIQQMSNRIKELHTEVEQLEAENEELKAKVARQAKRLYGRRTEQRQSGDRQKCPQPTETGPEQKDDLAPEESDQPRNRGQQPGAEGNGRRLRPELPTVETVHEVAPDDRMCPICGEPYYESSLTENSSQVEVEVIVRRHIHRRKRYLQGCHCEGVPLSVVAPKAGKIIPKGLLHHSVWTYILLEKWLHQRPLGRVLDVLELKGLDISQGTITGGLRRILPMLRPLYRRIMERNRSADRWKMDSGQLAHVRAGGWQGWLPVVALGGGNR